MKLLFSFVLVFFMIGTALADVMPAPTGVQSFNYYPPIDAILGTDPSVARPIGIGSIADEGDNYNLNVNLPQFSEPVDVYLGISAPLLSSEIFLISPDSTLKPASAGLVAWKTSTTGPIQQSIWGDIPETALPYGVYNFYLLVTPSAKVSPASVAGVLTKDIGKAEQANLSLHLSSVVDANSTYYLWKTGKLKCPTVFRAGANGTLYMKEYLGTPRVPEVTGSESHSIYIPFYMNSRNQIKGSSSSDQNLWSLTFHGYDGSWALETWRGTNNTKIKGEACWVRDNSNPSGTVVLFRIESTEQYAMDGWLTTYYGYSGPSDAGHVVWEETWEPFFELPGQTTVTYDINSLYFDGTKTYELLPFALATPVPPEAGVIDLQMLLDMVNLYGWQEGRRFDSE